MKLDSPALKMEFLKKKLKFVLKTMEEQEIDMWITFTREGNEDPLAKDLRFNDLTWRSAAIIKQNGERIAIVGNLDAEAIKQKKFYDLDRFRIATSFDSVRTKLEAKLIELPVEGG